MAKMRSIIITSLILFLISCKQEKLQSNYTSSLTEKNIFILDASSFRDSTWIPSKTDINNTLKQIESFISDPPLMDNYDSIKPAFEAKAEAMLQRLNMEVYIRHIETILINAMNKQVSSVTWFGTEK